MVTGQHAPQRGMLPSVACSSAWHVPQRGMFLSVACSPMWHPPQRGIFLSRPLWSCTCVCVRSEDLKRIGHGVR